MVGKIDFEGTSIGPMDLSVYRFEFLLVNSTISLNKRPMKWAHRGKLTFPGGQPLYLPEETRQITEPSSPERGR